MNESERKELQRLELKLAEEWALDGETPAMKILLDVTKDFRKEFDCGEVDAQEYIGLWLAGLDEEYWCTICMDRGEMERFLENRIPNKAEFLSFLKEGGAK